MYVVMAMRSWDKSFKYGEGEEDKYLDLSHTTDSIGFLEVYETREEAEKTLPKNAEIMEVKLKGE